jgi:hypothetical protein
MRKNQALKKFNNSGLSNNNVLKQVMEDLNLYAEVFIIDAKLPLLRSKLRLLHQTLEKGEIKILTRGLLSFLTRWPNKKIWLRIGTIIGKYAKAYGVSTLERLRILNTNRFVNSDEILEVLTSQKTMLCIKNE